MRWILACPLVVALAPLSGCERSLVYPGDELIADFSFSARRPLAADGGLDLTPVGELPTCALEPSTGLDNAVRSFEFYGTFSRCSGQVESVACSAPTAGQTYFTALGVSRDAGYDGQYAWIEPMTEVRSFGACPMDGGGCVTTLTETMRVAVFSVSQAVAVGLPFRCPPNALDGGVPQPDGGVVAPGFTQTSTGVDAVFACGELVDVVEATPECPCVQNGKIPNGRCAIRYSVMGSR